MNDTTSFTRRDFIKSTAAVTLAAGALPAQETPKTERNTSIRVAQIKVYPIKGDLKANHTALMEILGQIEKNEQVDVVITPEGFLDGYVSTEDNVKAQDMPRYAIDPAESAYARTVSDWARRNKSWVVFGCSRTDEGKVFNTALIYNRTGRLIATYDKTHLQNHDLKYTPGRHLSVYESDFGRFGVMICADRRWPETCRTLTLKGADVIFNPTYGMHNEINLCMMRTRAFENGIFIIFTHPGQSLITGPRGEIITNNTEDEQKYTVTEIDLERAIGNRGGHIVDRRTDLYEL